MPPEHDFHFNVTTIFENQGSHAFMFLPPELNIKSKRGFPDLKVQISVRCHKDGTELQFRIEKNVKCLRRLKLGGWMTFSGVSVLTVIINAVFLLVTYLILRLIPLQRDFVEQQGKISVQN